MIELPLSKDIPVSSLLHSILRVIYFVYFGIKLFLILHMNLKKLIKMRIEAWDSDLSSADDLIARFVSTEVPISSHTDFLNVELSKKEETSYNVEVR